MIRRSVATCRGFTMVELVVTSGLSVIVFAALWAALSSSRRHEGYAGLLAVLRARRLVEDRVVRDLTTLDRSRLAGAVTTSPTSFTLRLSRPTAGFDVIEHLLVTYEFRPVASRLFGLWRNGRRVEGVCLSEYALRLVDLDDKAWLIIDLALCDPGERDGACLSREPYRSRLAFRSGFLPAGAAGSIWFDYAYAPPR